MGIEDTILFENNAKYFAWKHPIKEIAPTTQFNLDHYRYEVVLLKDNVVLDVITEENQSINPSLFVDNNRVQVDVWYVKKGELIQSKWGTGSPIHIQDPKLNEFIPIRSYGECLLKVVDTEKFLVELLGNVNFDRTQVSQYFRGVIMSHFKKIISPYLFNNKISVVDVSQHVDDLTAHLKEKLNSILESYGVICKEFKIIEISYEKDGKVIVNESPKEVKPKVSNQQANQDECPNCKSKIQGKVNFCPNCGYKMIK